MIEQLARIKDKIQQLKWLDKEFDQFGAKQHKYLLNPVLPMEKIERFESKYGVTLPKDYVAFLTQLGNGGVGPYYGLEPFENALFADLDYKSLDSLLNPSRPFLHIGPWNMKFDPTVGIEEDENEYHRQLAAFEEKYFANEERDGVLAICNFGCAASVNLVVNGTEYGNVWIDYRASDGGIYPSDEFGNTARISFLDWYEMWLDQLYAHQTKGAPGKPYQG